MRLAIREFVVKMIWKADIDSITIAVESIDFLVDYGASFNCVRGRTRAFYRIDKLPDLGQVEQCRVTLYQNIDAGRVIPNWLVNRKASANESRSDDHRRCFVSNTSISIHVNRYARRRYLKP